jgi:hypothetical protein
VPAVVDPLDFRRRHAVSLALEDDRLALRGRLDLRLDEEPRLGEDLQRDGVRLGGQCNDFVDNLPK